METKRIRVLLIEDDPDYSQLIQMMLSKEIGDAFEVEWAQSLQAGLDQLVLDKTDVILLDLALPHSRKLDIFTSVHKQALEVPIVVLSCLDDEKTAIEAVHKGAQDYLVKSLVDGNLLARSLRYAIERHRLLEKLKRKTQELQSSEARNRAILDAIPDLMFQISKDGVLLDYRTSKNNDAILARSRFLGKKVHEVLPTEIAEQMMHYTERTLQADEPQIFEYQSPVRGDLRDYEARIIASGHDEVLAIVRDITKRKEVDRMRNQFIWRLRRAGLW